MTFLVSERVGTGRESEWGEACISTSPLFSLLLLNTTFLSFTFHPNNTIQGSCVWLTFTEAFRDNRIFSSEPLLHNQKKTQHLNSHCIVFAQFPHHSSVTGNSSLPPFFLRCCLLPCYWGSTVACWVSRSSGPFLGCPPTLRILTFFGGAVELSHSPPQVKVLPGSWQKSKAEAPFSQPHRPIRVFHPLREPCTSDVHAVLPPQGRSLKLFFLLNSKHFSFCQTAS